MRRLIAALPLAALAVAAAATADDGPATQLERMSWDESCAEIRAHLRAALDANAEIAPDARADIRDPLRRADIDADRAACLPPLKEAYDLLVAAYERTSGSANILGGATDAPATPTEATPETVEGQRTGERLGRP
ncbi:MAG: hypothetical protein ACLFU0_08025 [Alphaproteobacteria bacterium]